MTAKLADFDWQKTNAGFIGNNEHNVSNIKQLLDSKGCGFCMAKFKQVTLHLGTGMTHSCHHPSPHKIPLEEIEANPAALFNTKHLKHARKEMLNNERPSECDYCWRVEDDGGTSDRHYKSLEPWALDDFDETVKLTGDEDLYPSYLEVSFGNVCNLACTYCGPEFSSTWVQDLKQKGPLKIYEGKDNEQWVQGYQDLDTLNYRNNEFNPYIDAFWKWFPEASKHMKHYRITGGEPLMSKETFRSMDHLIENPNTDLEFSINTNLSVPDKLWNQFIEKLKLLKDGKVKKITIYTSAEGWDGRAEYARTNLDFDLFKFRYEQLLRLGNVRAVVMATFNIFAITSFKKLLEFIYEMKVKYNPDNTNQHLETSTGFKINPNTNDFTQRRKKNPDHSIVCGIDIPYLRSPEFLDVQICSHELVEEYLIPCLEYMSTHGTTGTWLDHQGFELYEIEKFKRIVIHRFYHNRKSEPERDTHADILKKRAKFYEFVNAIDERRGTCFLDVYPEMKDFYYLCAENHKTYAQWREIWKEEARVKKQKEEAQVNE